MSVVALVAAAGCGPFGYLKKVAKDASKAVADAKAAEAETYAPYEYWGAVSYLEQAKVLMAYSEYERSFDYGVRAKQLAEEAKQKADRREAGKTKEALDAGDGAVTLGGEGKPAGDAKASGQAGGGKAKGKLEVGGGVGGGK
jgi:ABC-type iron transport system FetAB ATPase subunit